MFLTFRLLCPVPMFTYYLVIHGAIYFIYYLLDLNNIGILHRPRWTRHLMATSFSTEECHLVTTWGCFSGECDTVNYRNI